MNDLIICDEAQDISSKELKKASKIIEKYLEKVKKNNCPVIDEGNCQE